jgi:hypothetical protein
MGMPAIPTTGWTVDMLETLPDDGKRYEIIRMTSVRRFSARRSSGASRARRSRL